MSSSTPDYGAIARDLFLQAPKTTNFNRLRKRLKRQVGDTMRRYAMVKQASAKPTPRWLVCLSGGKDSFALLGILLDLKAHGDLPVDILACNLDQRQPGFPAETLPNWFESFAVPYRIETQDTYSCLLYTSPSPRDGLLSRMPSSA